MTGRRGAGGTREEDDGRPNLRWHTSLGDVPELAPCASSPRCRRAAGPGTVIPISTVTNRAGKPIPVGRNPFRIAITPDGKTVYVVNMVSGTVTPITAATNTLGTPIPVGRRPYAIAITPDGSTAYVANYGSNTVTPITTATNRPGMPIPVGRGPSAIAITPDGKTAYVADSGTFLYTGKGPVSGPGATLMGLPGVLVAVLIGVSVSESKLAT